MTKKSIGLYLTDKYIYLCSKDKIFKENINEGIIVNNRISKSDEFYKSISKIIKKNKLNESIIGKNILVVDLPNYLKSDKELISSILEKTAFDNINFINYNELLENNHTYNFNDCNAIITIDENNFFIDYKLFFNQDITEAILNLITMYLNDQSIFLIGSLPNLKELALLIENEYKIKTFIYDDSDIYIINNLKNLATK